MARYKIPRIYLLVLVLIAFSMSINADVPGTMNYQGRLTDDSGNPVADMQYNVRFKIYDETSTVRWEELHILTTTEGFFSVQLGSAGAPLTADIFDHAECRLGITVGNDSEITPRTQLNTVPYAFKTGSVQSPDIVNEPGVAAFSGAYYLFLDAMTYTVICSLTINCPAEGYVMAVAHGRLGTIPHTEGIHSYAIVGISDVPTSLPGNQDLDFHVDSAAASGKYFTPFGMTSMFEVPSAGSYTYYYLGYEFSGDITVADMQFNLVYFPTAYGIVDPVPPPVKADDGVGSVRLDDPAPMVSEINRAKADTLNVARLERELALMKAKIEMMQRQIDNNVNERR